MFCLALRSFSQSSVSLSWAVKKRPTLACSVVMVVAVAVVTSLIAAALSPTAVVAIVAAVCSATSAVAAVTTAVAMTAVAAMLAAVVAIVAAVCSATSAVAVVLLTAVALLCRLLAIAVALWFPLMLAPRKLLRPRPPLPSIGQLQTAQWALALFVPC